MVGTGRSGSLKLPTVPVDSVHVATMLKLLPPLSLTLSLVLLPGCAPRGHPASSGATLIIRGGTLIDGTGGAPREASTIVVRDGRITAVVDEGELEVPAGAKVVDASGKYVVPGFADMHTHFSLGFPAPRRPDETEEVLRRQLYYGVTSVLQMGATDGDPDTINLLRERRRSGRLEAPHVYGTGGHLTPQGCHPIYTIFPPAIRAAADSLAAATPLEEPVDLFELGIGLSFVRTPEAARKAVLERAGKGMHAIKITVESGPTNFGDDHPQMRVEMIRTIVDAAAAEGLRVFAHATSPDELEAVAAGGAAGIVHAIRDRPLPDAALARQLADAGLLVVPCLVLYASPVDFRDPFLLETVSEEELGSLRSEDFLRRVCSRWEFPDESPAEGGAPQRWSDILTSVGVLHQNGVTLVLGTDTGNPFVFPGYSVHHELELLVRAGLPPMQALVAATRNAARMIGAEAEFGTIEVGRRADLLVLDADPLEDIRNTRTLETVVLEGRVVDRGALLR